MPQIGFTGTRHGMTAEQEHMLHVLLRLASIGSLHHGDCKGADEQVHALCRLEGIPVVLHPPASDKLRAFCEGAERVMDPLPYLQRDRALVHATSRLLAAPAEMHEPTQQRAGGTWYTVRYARKLGRPVLIVRPDGKLAVG